MRSTALIRLGLILGLGLLTACGGGGGDDLQSPAKNGKGVGDGGAGGDAEDGQDGSTGDGGGTGDGARGLAPVFVGAEPPQLHLRGMGGQQTSTVTFQLLDRSGSPIAGDAVSLSLSRVTGGVALEPDLDGNPTSETVFTDSDGNAVVQLVSGNAQGPIQVIARHDRTGGEGRSRDIVISTGLADADRFSISVSDYAPADAYYVNGVSVEVNIHAPDQYGNPAFDGTQVSFRSPESGFIEQTCTLENGECTVSWTSANGKRPADGRVTVLAFTNGAEWFKDQNDNGIYDYGEDFNDLSEAWADLNEDGQFDESVDDFVDSKGRAMGTDGVWDPAEALGEVWDGPCLKEECDGESSVTIWRQVVLILSQSKHPQLFKYPGDLPGNEGDECMDPGLTPMNPAPNSSIGFPGPITLGAFYVADGTPLSNVPCHVVGNPMPSGTTFTFSAENAEIMGRTSWTVPTTAYAATQVGPVNIIPGTEPGDGLLTLTVAPPSGEETEFQWILDR